MNPERTGIDALRIERKDDHARTRGGSILLVGVGLIFIAAVFWWFRSSQSIEVTTAQVRLNNAETGASRTLLNASGYVTARRAATVSSKVTGKVKEINIEEGMKVEGDAVLARLDSSNVEVSLALAEAQLESSRKIIEETKPNLAFAQQELKRFTELSATRAVSESDLRRAEMESRAMSARLVRQTAEIAVAEQQVAQWKQQLDDMVIRAPFGGVVTSKNAQPGEMISPMSVGGFTRTGICTIVDMSSLEIEVDVNESFINRVQPGQRVEATLDAYPDWRIPAKVIAIIPTADRQKATVKVRVGFDQLDPRILPEMGVKVAFQSTAVAEAKRPVSNVLIPKAAIQRSGDRDTVWVFSNDRAERRAITVEQVNGNDCVVNAGLSSNERVVINPPADLNERMHLREKKQ